MALRSANGLGSFAVCGSAEILTAFEAAYRTLFGRVIDGLAAEITNWALTVATKLPSRDAVDRHGHGTAVPQTKTRRFFDAALRSYVEAQEVDRAEMTPGQAVDGPAIIVETETTTIVTSAYRAVGQGDGSLRLIAKEARP